MSFSQQSYLAAGFGLQGGGGSVDNVTLTIRAPEPVTLEVVGVTLM
jgi:hypothetical protein